jgi:hypothetical protein
MPAEVAPRLIGAVTGATIWVPEATLSSPLVLTSEGADDAGAGLGAAAAGFWRSAAESPMTPADVAPIVIGMVTGATIWVPDAMPLLPSVEAAGATAGAGAGAPAVWVVAAESPTSPRDVAPRFTGTVIGAMTWVPEATPSAPLVSAPGAGAGAAAGEPLPALRVLALESPRRPTEVAPRLMGMLMGATAWVPDSSPSVPDVVSAALAATPPKAKRPPANAVPRRHLRMLRCDMGVLS